MKFNILLVLASFAVQVMTASKLRTSGFPAFSMPAGGSMQLINMKNVANSITNALAVNAGYFGDANAFASGNSGNYNQVYQSAATPTC